MRKLSLGILLVFCNLFATFAGEIKGVVFSKSGERLEFVTIQLKGTNTGGTTDSRGRFNFRKLTNGH